MFRLIAFNFIYTAVGHLICGLPLLSINSDAYIASIPKFVDELWRPFNAHTAVNRPFFDGDPVKRSPAAAADR